MCPICLTTAALIAGGAAAAKRLAVAEKKKSGEIHTVDNRSTFTPSKTEDYNIQRK